MKKCEMPVLLLLQLPKRSWKETIRKVRAVRGFSIPVCQGLIELGFEF